jgi:hypothetical protein
MTDDKQPPVRGIEHRFRDLSADVREERLVRYILHQLDAGRRVEDIVNDAHVVEHFGEAARKHILEHPDVIKGVEERLRTQFAGYGDSVGNPKATKADQDSTGRASDDQLSDL